MTQDGTEWTLVVHKRHAQASHTHTRKPKNKARAHTQVNGAHARLDSLEVDDREIQRSIQTVQSLRASWAASTQGQRLRAFLEHRQHHFSSAILVGLGNLDPAAIRDRYRALWQLAVYLDMVYTIRTNLSQTSEAANVTTVPPELTLLAQDPAFTAFDKKLLAALEVDVQVDAMQHSTPQSLLFVPFVDAVVLLPQIIKDNDPQLYVGTDITMIVERMSMPTYASMGQIPQPLVDESLDIARRFLLTRQPVEIDFNGFNELSLYGLSIYDRTSALIR